MRFRNVQWAVAAGAIVLVGVGSLTVWGGWKFGERMAQVQATGTRATAPGYVSHLQTNVKARLFDRQSVYDFLGAAKRAEAITDPLQRCLAYPDPPGSHWSKEAVRAYCEYRTYPTMSYDDVRGLLQQGQFDELDRRLSTMLDEKLNKPAAMNVLDHAFDLWFNRSDLELRTLIEHWKQASPRSAFAYAASGVSYVSMAWHARGTKFISETPRSSIEAMDRFLALADTDLRRAVELDPRVTPAYVEMIEAGRLSLGHAYIQQAQNAGLREDPANFAIYNELMRALTPKWGGSVDAMARNGEAALAHAKANPVLVLLPEKALAEEVDLNGDDCTTAGRFEKFSQVFDQIAVASQLADAGSSAEECGHLELSTVYYSESLRFNPQDNESRFHRAYNLNEFDESAWAASDAASLLRTDPKNVQYLTASGYAHESMNDYAQAEKDYLAAIAIAPDDGDALAKLAGLYANQMQAWDKAWSLDQRIIDSFPNDPYGWLLRAQIQESQPRPGLKETADYFQAHFDKTPGLHQALQRMRAAQALQAGTGKTATK